MVTGRTLRFSTDEIGLMFSLTLAQAAATLAATLVGESIGLFDGEVVNAVVVVVLLSILIASLGTAAFARRVEAPEVELAPIGERVVVGLPVDGPAEMLAALAGDLAVAGGGSVVAVATAATPDGLADARTAVGHAVDRLVHRGADAEGIPRLASSRASGLVDTTAELDGSLILMQWEHRSRVSQLLAPSSVDQVGRSAAVPVAAVRFNGTRISRVVLGLADEAVGDLVDCRLALELARLASTGAGVPLVVLEDDGAEPVALEVPTGVERVVVDDRTVLEQLQEGDLIVLPVGRARRAFGTNADEVSAAIPGMSIVVVAAPGRLAPTSTAYLTGGGVRGAAGSAPA